MEGFSDYLFAFLGDIRTYVANFKMQEVLLPFLQLWKNTKGQLMNVILFCFKFVSECV